MGFGKHRFETYRFVATLDPSYGSWMRRLEHQRRQCELSCVRAASGEINCRVSIWDRLDAKRFGRKVYSEVDSDSEADLLDLYQEIGSMWDIFNHRSSERI